MNFAPATLVPHTGLWQAPSALTHATWHAAHAECQVALGRSGDAVFTIDWQQCQQIDSSALAFILELKRHAGKPIAHRQAPIQLRQLARLYEVETVLDLE
jgi:ABC-type transporter Mla MlaB component